MLSRSAPIVALLGIACGPAVVGCASSVSPPPSALCTGNVAALRRALATAPAAVRLADGSSISSCVARSVTDARLQEIGAALTPLADGLAQQAKRSDAGAMQLGYLIGAVRRGAAHSNGIHAELVRRIEQSALLDGSTAARRAAIDRGVQAGGRLG